MVRLILGSLAALVGVITLFGFLIPVAVWGLNGIPDWYLVPDVLGSLAGGSLVGFNFVEKA